jgi:hypothetical protein
VSLDPNLQGLLGSKLIRPLKLAPAIRVANHRPRAARFLDHRFSPNGREMAHVFACRSRLIT